MSIIGHMTHLGPFENTFLLYLDQRCTPVHGNCIPSPPTLTVSVDGNIYAFPWLGDY